MKKCLQCEQVYGDETNFCLSDGSTLVSTSDSFASSAETPTILSNKPFIPPISTAPPEPKKNNPILIAAIAGFLILLFGGAIIGLIVYGLSKSPTVTNVNVANVSNADDKSNKNAVVEQKSNNDNLAQNLKEQRDKLEKDKKKLADERKALEAKKQETDQPTQDAYRTATIIDPPTNIRLSPNGTVLCVVKQRTTVNITGTTDVRDNNGVWYYTDACGKQGVVHSSQIRF